MPRLLPLATLAAALLCAAGCGDGKTDPPANPDMKTPNIPPGRTNAVPDQPGKKK